jgi:hypothetical protein
MLGVSYPDPAHSRVLLGSDVRPTRWIGQPTAKAPRSARRAGAGGQARSAHVRAQALDPVSPIPEPDRIAPESEPLPCERHVAASYLERWRPDDADARHQAIADVEGLLPRAGWLTRALGSHATVRAAELLADWL